MVFQYTSVFATYLNITILYKIYKKQRKVAPFRAPDVPLRLAFASYFYHFLWHSQHIIFSQGPRRIIELLLQTPQHRVITFLACHTAHMLSSREYFLPHRYNLQSKIRYNVLVGRWVAFFMTRRHAILVLAYSCKVIYRFNLMNVGWVFSKDWY